MTETGAMPRVYARIAGTGSYLPANAVSNDDLAKRVDTSDEWIASRTGIRNRHVAAEGETTSLTMHLIEQNWDKIRSRDAKDYISENWDADTADNIMQCLLFGEVIYG